MEGHTAASTPLLKAQTVNATATVTGEWFQVKNGYSFAFYAYHSSTAGTGDVTYYVDMYFKPGGKPASAAATDYYRVTLGNIAADSTVSQYLPEEFNGPCTFVRGIATGGATNPSDTSANLYMVQY